MGKTPWEAFADSSRSAPDWQDLSYPLTWKRGIAVEIGRRERA